MDEKTQQEFIIFIANKMGIKDQKQLNTFLNKLKTEDIKILYDEFISSKKPTVAKMGSKINYLRGLYGICPKGYTIKTYKVGGKVTKCCTPIEDTITDPIELFKHIYKRK